MLETWARPNVNYFGGECQALTRLSPSCLGPYFQALSTTTTHSKNYTLFMVCSVSYYLGFLDAMTSS